MTKKIVVLCTFLCMNSFISGDEFYRAEQGRQVQPEPHGHHHHHGHHPQHGNQRHNNSDKITDDADQRRLNVLDEEDASAKMYNNLAKIGVAAGGIGAVTGFWYKQPYAIVSGIATFGISATGIHLISDANKKRADERKEILERRAKYGHH